MRTVTFKLIYRENTPEVKDLSSMLLEIATGELKGLKVTPIYGGCHFIHYKTENPEVIEDLFKKLHTDFILEEYTIESGPGTGIRA